MPTCRRKRVVLTEPSPALLQLVKADPNKEVYYLEQTGEIFESYEAYAARMSFYRLKQFQCDVTGKSNMDYFQALESELQEARVMHSRFPEPLKPSILKAVQWQVMGRLDHLVEAVYERFKDRYFEDERIFVDVQGEKFFAKIVKVFPPKRPESQSPIKNGVPPLAPPEPPIHGIIGDLKIPAKEAMAHDDPTKYFYKVQILEEERERSKNSHHKEVVKHKWNGSLMEVQCTAMSRDRLSFSKSILRRFIRDCVDREAAVASPWTVKPAIAKRYGVVTEMPEEVKKGVDNIKRGETDKRKKVWEDKLEGPPAKKQRKMTAAQEERARAAATLAEKKERDAQEKAERQQAAKEEAERIAAEKKKKKPVRYPTEDLDVRLSDKEKKAGMKIQRPIPNRTLLPFNNTPGTFESFLMAWNFLVVYGQPLHLSTFTLDEFEAAMRHSVLEPDCPLLAEIHSTLIYHLRTVPFRRHSAVISLDASGWKGPVYGVSYPDLIGAMADVGNNWERVPLRHAEGREGWQDALVGCLKDHANLYNFPALRQILTKLLFAPDQAMDVETTSSATSRSSTPEPQLLGVPSSPLERYYALPPADRIAIISFMCSLAVSSKAIHTHMESCEEQLTTLRKEKIEVNRTKKTYQEEIAQLSGEKEGEAKEGETKKEEDELAGQDSSDLSDVPMSEGSESSIKAKKENKLLQKAQSQAKQRQIAREKVAQAKQAAAEIRRIDEEINKLDRRLEGIEREFRKLLGSIRVKPLGRDRFYNRIWWFDGMGSASLLGSGGVVQYGTGRLFIQGPSEFDVEILQRREAEDQIEQRRKDEEGEDGVLGVGEWAVYTEIEEIDEFVSWLNPKGVRENALKNQLTKWWQHLNPGMRKRLADINNVAKLPDARRSSRRSGALDISREPYMLWTNRRAVTSS